MRRLLLAVLGVALGAGAAGCLDFDTRDGVPYCDGDAPAFDFCSVRVEGISPTEGSAGGGLRVVVTGTGFDASTSFQLGGVALRNVTVSADGRRADPLAGSSRGGAAASAAPLGAATRSDAVAFAGTSAPSSTTWTVWVGKANGMPSSAKRR